MKINKNYIEMCKKAQEIQELRNQFYHNGDYYYLNRKIGKEENQFETADYINNIQINVCEKENICLISTIYNWWLPRQDQLQEIYLNKIIECLKNKNLKIPDSIFDLMISIFADYLKGINHNSFNNNWDLVKEENREQFKNYYENLNMEIFWLEFIMLHIFNKKWNFINENWEIFK